jgi:hypothetical protein
VHRRIQKIHFGEDLRRRLGPGEGLGVGVVLGGVTVDRSLEVDHGTEDAGLQTAPRERGEERLDCIEPGAMRAAAIRHDRLKPGPMDGSDFDLLRIVPVYHGHCAEGSFR